MGGNPLGLFDLISTKPAIEGLRLVLVGGQSLGEAWFQLLLLSMLTVIYLTVGLFTYSRKHLTPKD